MIARAYKKYLLNKFATLKERSDNKESDTISPTNVEYKDSETDVWKSYLLNTIFSGYY